MGLRAHGWSTVRDAVRRNIELTRLLEELLTEAGFTVLRSIRRGSTPPSAAYAGDDGRRSRTDIARFISPGQLLETWAE
jgi:hypothetical protein